MDFDAQLAAAIAASLNEGEASTETSEGQQQRPSSEANDANRAVQAAASQAETEELLLMIAQNESKRMEEDRV